MASRKSGSEKKIRFEQLPHNQLFKNDRTVSSARKNAEKSVVKYEAVPLWKLLGPNWKGDSESAKKTVAPKPGISRYSVAPFTFRNAVTSVKKEQKPRMSIFPVPKPRPGVRRQLIADTPKQPINLPSRRTASSVKAPETVGPAKNFTNKQPKKTENPQKKQTPKRKAKPQSSVDESLGIISICEDLPSSAKKTKTSAKKIVFTPHPLKDVERVPDQNSSLSDEIIVKNLREVESSLVNSLEQVREALKYHESKKSNSKKTTVKTVPQNGNFGPFVEHSYSVMNSVLGFGSLKELHEEPIAEMECEVVDCLEQVDNEDSFANLEMKLNIVHKKEEPNVSRKPLVTVENSKSSNPAMQEYLALRNICGGILTTPIAKGSAKKSTFQTPRTRISSTVMKQLKDLYEDSQMS